MKFNCFVIEILEISHRSKNLILHTRKIHFPLNLILQAKPKLKV